MSLLDQDEEIFTSLKEDPFQTAGTPPPNVFPFEYKSQVIRKNTDLLTAEDITRFRNAFKRLVDTGEFRRIATYHVDLCKHRFSAFPIWHLCYMIEFEIALIKADRENQRVSKVSYPTDLGLPYWGWVRSKKFPNFTYEPLFINRLVNGRNVARNPSSSIISRIENSNTVQSVLRGLSETKVRRHYEYASIGPRSSNLYSVEQPHNNIHNFIGATMADLKKASFDVAFFLHHCEVNRQYESYLRNRLAKTPKQQLLNEILADIPTNDLGRPVLYPFSSAQGVWTLPQIFDLILNDKLYYTYDSYEPPTRFLLQEPLCVVFEGCLHSTLKYKSMTIYAYIQYNGAYIYAGLTSVFSRVGKCLECDTRGPFNLYIDISQALSKHNIPRDQIKIEIECHIYENDTEKKVPYTETGLPQFKIQYNLIPQIEMKKGDHSNSIKHLQAFLKKYGYLKDYTEGTFDDATEEAIKKIQKMLNVPQDGHVTPELIDRLKQSRCSNSDQITAEKFKLKTNSTYSVSNIPTNLNSKQVYSAIAYAFKEWGKFLGVKFTLVTDNADFKIKWYKTESDAIFPFDGYGGILAQTENGAIVLDSAEVWTLNPHQKKGYNLYIVILHEIGHLFGLDHSTRKDDVMTPYYNSNNYHLSLYDKLQGRNKIEII